MRGIGPLVLSAALASVVPVPGSAARAPRADAYAPAPDAMDYQESQARYGAHAPVQASVAPVFGFARTATGAPPRAAARYALWPGSVPRPVPRDLTGGTLPARGPASARAEAPGEGRGLYVEIDLEGADLRDAVADLSRAAGFRMERREPPDPAAGRRATLRGWLKGERLGAAAAMSRVRRIEVLGPAARERKHPSGAMTEVLVGLRLPEEVPPARALRRALVGLARKAEFEAGRVIGYQAIPGTRQSALIVSGRLPIRRISLLLADPAVVKIAPAPARPDPPASDSVPRKPWLRRFLAFAADRHPALLGAAALLTFSVVAPTSRRRRRRRLA